MGRKLLFPLFAAILVPSAAAFGQDYNRTYTMTSGAVSLTLTLDQDAAGRITGTLSGTKGARFRLEGTVTEGVATGRCVGETGESYFEAEFEDRNLSPVDLRSDLHP